MRLSEMTIDRFAGELASDSPAPGGGSAAALAGSLAAALCAMAARLTLGRDKYRDAFAEMDIMREKADALTVRLLEQVDEDTAAYNKVMAAYRLPKVSDEEKAARSLAIQTAVKEAALAPLETLRRVGEIVDLARLAIEKGNRNCITDAGVAAQFIRAAANGAVYNVRVNLSSIKDEEFRGRLAAETDEILARTLSEVEIMEAIVNRTLG
jgi:formiminotetrahydrofolate cyclodeaminase